MRVGIDAHMVGSQETGNETYVRGLVEGFAARPGGVELDVFAVTAPWTSPTPAIRYHRLLSANPYLRLGAELPVRALARRLDLLHMTYSAPAWSATPLVLTVHDICFVTNPEWFSERDLRVLNANVPRSIRAAAHVITDSLDARARIIDAYRVAESRISAIPIGAGAAAQPIPLAEAKEELRGAGLSTDRPYLLAVGNLQPRKNIVRLVEAFVSIAASHDVDLVIVGPKRYRAEDAVKAAAAIADRVRFTGYLTDRQLAASYACATAFVFPSLYEGFGLPVLEAMSHGVPTACSNAGALPEICGDAALLFDPREVDAIGDAAGRLLDDSTLRARLATAGPEQAKKFSWERCAELTAAAYRQALRA